MRWIAVAGLSLSVALAGAQDTGQSKETIPTGGTPPPVQEQAGPKTLPGVTFSDMPDVVYVPLKNVGFALGFAMRSEGKKFFVNEREIQTGRYLLDGTRLLAARDFAHLGCEIEHDPALDQITISKDGQLVYVPVGEKKIEINKSSQTLRAFQGGFLVAETPVSTGKPGFTTPNGRFEAGPEKSRLRYSRKYDNAPMPWSIQIYNGFFMHGYRSVPKYPASHGCVRLPMWGANAAKWLWSWTDLGTPITIANEWETQIEEPGAGAIGKSTTFKRMVGTKRRSR